MKATLIDQDNPINTVTLKFTITDSWLLLGLVNVPLGYEPLQLNTLVFQ
jgi:hypothetical protein